MVELPSLWQPLEKENIRDPYPMYDRLRKEDPVYKSQTGEWILTRHEDVKRVLSDKRFIVGNRLNWFKNMASYAKNTARELDNLPSSIEGFLLFKNQPDHKVIRDILISAWPTKEEFSDVINHYIHQLLPNKSQEIDVANDFARPLSTLVIGKILGIEEQESKQLSNDGFQMVKVMDLYIKASDVRGINSSAGILSNFFRKKLNKPDSLDDSGLLHRLLQKKFSQLHEKGNEKLVSLSIFLFLAGLETTSNLISLNLYHLIKDPNLLNAIRKNPENLAIAQEELTRFDSPVQLLGRSASEDINIGGKKIQKGDTLTLGIGAANRDPEKFTDPNSINFRRESIPHLSFGAGAHYCLGDTIAKSEAILTLEYILPNFSNLEITNEPEWEIQLAIRKIKSLRIEFTAK